ncbi:MAG: hypothetical protein AAFR55_10150, partial [Pseudomonadota bacterium]
NWIILMGLVYLGSGFIGLSSAVSRGSLLAGASRDRANVAAAHQAYGVKFATLLALLGLACFGWAQFDTMGFGPPVVAMLMGLVALLVVHVFAADYFAEPDLTTLQQAAARAAGRQPITVRAASGSSVTAASVGLVEAGRAAVGTASVAAMHGSGPAGHAVG